jgi:hypothetical protein
MWRGLPFLWTVDAVKADTFRVVVVQDFDGVTVLDGDDGASKGEGFTDADENEQNEKSRVPHARIVYKTFRPTSLGHFATVATASSTPERCRS